MNVIVICGDHKRNNCIIEYLKKINYVNILKIFVLKRENTIPSTQINLTQILKSCGIYILKNVKKLKIKI